MFKRQHHVDKNNNNVVLCILSGKEENKKFSLFDEMLVNYGKRTMKKENKIFFCILIPFCVYIPKHLKRCSALRVLTYFIVGTQPSLTYTFVDMIIN